MDDTSSNATSVGVRLIRRRSQFSGRRLLSKNAAPFIHCLYLIYARKFYVSSHGKITRQWKKKTLTHIIINRTGLAEMRGPVLWLQHTSSTPDTSTRRPYVPTMLQGPLACSGEYKTKTKTTMTVQNFSLTLLVLSAKTMYKRTGSTMLGVVASVLAVECTRMQQLPTMLGPAVHRGKDTTHKTLKTMCNLRAWPQQLMLEEVCKRIQHCCATLRRSHTQKKKCWELLAQKFVGQQVCVRLNAEQGMAQCWERSPPTNVARVQIPTSMP